MSNDWLNENKKERIRSGGQQVESICSKSNEDRFLDREKHRSANRSVHGWLNRSKGEREGKEKKGKKMVKLNQVAAQFSRGLLFPGTGIVQARATPPPLTRP